MKTDSFIRPKGRFLPAGIIAAFLGIILICYAAVHFTGCAESDNSNVTKIKDLSLLPPAEGKALFKLENKSNPKLNLQRNSTIYEFSAAPDMTFHVNDMLRNIANEMINLVQMDDESRFAVNPGAKVNFLPSSLVLNTGKVQFEFRKLKGAYRVVIPGAVLAVRGTRFEVSVGEDERSLVELYEGEVAIVHNNGETTLKPGEKAVFEPKGTAFQIMKLDDDLPEVFNKLDSEKAIKTIR